MPLAHCWNLSTRPTVWLEAAKIYKNGAAGSTAPQRESYIRSTIAFSVALGRIAAAHIAPSGK